jgi:predicted AAA+ superfamily ATPase
LAASDSASLRWRQSFITTYLERDIPQLGPRLPAQTLRRLWTMLAHEQGQLVQASKLAASLAISAQTVARYVDVLCDVMLVRRLQPWASNSGKRLVRSPKLYVRDSGLVHALLGLKSMDDLLAHPVAGGSWEGLVIENLVGAAPMGTQASFYRSAGGAEVDLVLEFSARERWAIEVKRSRSPTVSRGFHVGAQDLQATRRIVVHGGQESYPMGSGVEAMSLSRIMDQLTQHSR